jgi:hypothetical protein
VYGLLAGFQTSAELTHAIHQIRAKGYVSIEAYTPFPDEEVTEALGKHGSLLPLLVLLGGITGGVGGFFMQYWMAAVSYPVVVGGKPLNSWPMFIPVTFELTILCAALAAVLGMLALNGLPRPHHPLFNVPAFDRASRDRFFLSVQSIDPRFDLAATRDFLAALNPETLEEVPW